MEQYMVTFNLPSTINQKFASLIPEQRSIIDELLNEGVLSSYMLSADRSVLWTVVNAKNELQVIEIISTFPLTRYMKTDIKALVFNLHPVFKAPEPSLN